VRRSRTDLRARVNGDLPLEFGDVALTSYAGLELFGRYLRATGFNGAVRAAWTGTPRWGDFGAVAMVRLLIGLLVVGGRRLRHLAFVQDDPLFQRFCEVRLVPTARTVSRWLQGFTMTTVASLQAINTTVIARVLATLGVRTWTIDVDGVVLSTGLQVERAFRGFNPQHRKVRELLPDHGAPGGDHACAAGEESVRERPRRESGAALPARPVDAAGHAAAGWGHDALSHGWRVFSPGCAAVAWRQAAGYAIKVPF
jgi:hypothetical protein